MVVKRVPDFKIETQRELDEYLRLWTDRHVGVRLNHRVAEKVKKQILSKEIPHNRKVNRYTTVAPNYTLGVVVMYYMLATSLGARYGIHFGHWTDDGRNYYSWQLRVHSTLIALNYLLDILLTRVSAMRMGKRMLRLLPIMSSEVDKEWNEVIARDSRKNEQMLEAIAHELANAEGMSADDFVEPLYEVEFGERLRQKSVNILMKLDDFDEPLHEVELGEMLRRSFINIVMKLDDSNEPLYEVEFREMPQPRDVNTIKKGEKGFDGVSFLRPNDAAHLAFSAPSTPNDFPQAMREKAKAAIKKWMKTAEELDG